MFTESEWIAPRTSLTRLITGDTQSPGSASSAAAVARTASRSRRAMKSRRLSSGPARTPAMAMIQRDLRNERMSIKNPAPPIHHLKSRAEGCISRV